MTARGWDSFQNRLQKKELQGFPGAAAQIGRNPGSPIRSRQAPRKYRRRIFGSRRQNAGGNLLEHLGTEPFQSSTAASDGRRDRNDGACRRRPEDTYGGNHSVELQVHLAGVDPEVKYPAKTCFSPCFTHALIKPLFESRRIKKAEPFPTLPSLFQRKFRITSRASSEG